MRKRFPYSIFFIEKCNTQLKGKVTSNIKVRCSQKKHNYHPQFGICGTSTISSASSESVTSKSPSSDDEVTLSVEVSRWIALANLCLKTFSAYIRSGYLTEEYFISSWWGNGG